MSQAPYVLGAWAVTLAACGVYVAGLLVRGRRLVRRVRAASGEKES